MLEHIEAYCTVNEIDNPELLIAAGQHILDDEDLEVVNFARKGAILLMFKQYIQGQLTLEQFINNGEELNDALEVVHHAGGIFEQPYWREAPVYMMKRLELDDMVWANTLLILEKKIWDAYAHQEVLQYMLEERHSSIVCI